MPQVRLKQFAQDGATDTQVLTWNNTAGKWEPDDASGGTTILTGAVDPTTEGSTGDFYYNTVKQGFWYKDTGGWEEVGVVADDTTIEIHATNGLQVKDNGITLAKMAGGTDGNLITYDASGDPAYVATGTSGHVLTSNGAGAAPTFQAGGGGSASDNMPACFRNTGSTNIVNTADTQVVFNTTDVSDTNYSLATGTVTVTAAGTYFISYTVPIQEDGVGGEARTHAYAWVEDDSVIIPQSHCSVYVRETSGGSGMGAGFVVTLGASSDIEVFVRSDGTTDISSTTGQAQLSIFKLGTG